MVVTIVRPPSAILLRDRMITSAFRESKPVVGYIAEKAEIN
jgi:hypothetical protein